MRVVGKIILVSMNKKIFLIFAPIVFIAGFLFFVNDSLAVEEECEAGQVCGTEDDMGVIEGSVDDSSSSAPQGCTKSCVAEGLFTKVPLECLCCGNCTPDDILQVVVNIMNMILGVVGSLMLLMFMYGGILIITSGGKAESVEKGKKTLINAAIGGILVISAWLIVNYLVVGLVKKDYASKKDIRLNIKN